MPTFDYIAPPTLFECLKILMENPGALVYAGGTDLMVKIRDKLMHPEILLDIKGIEKLKGIRLMEDGSLQIGPLATHNEIAGSPIIQEKFPFLADACRWVGSNQIRNRGTIGGNVCNGSPAAETLPVLYVLEAKLHLETVTEKREILIDKFYLGPQKTCIKRGEILTSIEIPPITVNYDGIYLRHSRRRAVDIASVTCAILYKEDNSTPSGKLFSVALGAVAPTVVRAKNAEDILNSFPAFDNEIIDKVATTALQDICPIDDIRTTCNYRNDITYVLLKRALTGLLCRKGKSR